MDKTQLLVTMKDSSACIEGEILDSGYSSEEQKIYTSNTTIAQTAGLQEEFFFSCPVAISHIAVKIFKSCFVDTMKDFYIVFKIYLIVQKKIFLVELKFWNGCICASLSPPLITQNLLESFPSASCNEHLYRIHFPPP